MRLMKQNEIYRNILQPNPRQVRCDVFYKRDRTEGGVEIPSPVWFEQSVPAPVNHKHPTSLFEWRRLVGQHRLLASLDRLRSKVNALQDHTGLLIATAETPLLQHVRLFEVCTDTLTALKESRIVLGVTAGVAH